MKRFSTISYQHIERWMSIAFLGITLGVLAFSLWSLTSFPVVFIDEPWVSDAAWNFANNGILFDTMNEGILDRAAGTQSQWPLIGALPYAAAFKTLGLGLWQGRFASWLIGVALLGMVFLFARLAYNPLSAALAVLFLAISWVFLQASHYIRPDITLALFVILGLYFYLLGIRKEKNWPFLVSGLIMGLSVDAHPNGILIALTLAVLHVIRCNKRLFKEKSTWFFALGAILGAVYYFGLRYGFQFSAAMQLSPVESKILPLPITTLDPITILKGFYGEFGRYNFFDHPLEFVLIGSSLLYILARRQKSDRLLLGFLAISLTLFALVSPNKHTIYAILFYPFFAILIAETFVSALREKKVFSPEGIIWGGLLAFTLLSFAIHYFRPIWNSRAYNYYQTTQAIQETIPDGARVVAMPYWWLGLPESDYRSILGITYLHILDGSTLTEALDKLAPEYLLIDPSIRGRMVDEGYFALGSFSAYLMPRQEFLAYLEARGEMVLEFTDPWHGLIEVYRISEPTR